MADIELKENILQREMGKADLESDQAKSAKSKKFHVTCRTQMDSLSHEAALEMIDWLAFSKEIEDCNFYRQMPKTGSTSIKGAVGCLLNQSVFIFIKSKPKALQARYRYGIFNP